MFVNSIILTEHQSHQLSKFLINIKKKMQSPLTEPCEQIKAIGTESGKSYLKEILINLGLK